MRGINHFSKHNIMTSTSIQIIGIIIFIFIICSLGPVQSESLDLLQGLKNHTPLFHTDATQQNQIRYNSTHSFYTTIIQHQGLMLTFKKGTVTITSESWNHHFITLQPRSYGYEGFPIPLQNNPLSIIHHNRIDYIYSNHISSWYESTDSGLEQGFFLFQPPFPRLGQRLHINIDIHSSLTPFQSDKRTHIQFKDEKSTTVAMYHELHVFDAFGTKLDSYFIYDGNTNSIILSIDDKNAIYPLTIDPLITSYIRKITANDGDSLDNFGFSVSLSNDYLIVGSRADDVNGNISQGSAYLFYRNNHSVEDWGQIKKLIASDGEAGDQFGRSVSINNNSIVIGSSEDNFDGKNDIGSAYVFAKDQGGVDNWGEVKKLVATDGAEEDNLGRSVSIYRDTIAVGAYMDDIGVNDDQGSVYVFSKNHGGPDNWGEAIKLNASDGNANDHFGGAVSIYENTLVVGAQNDNIGGNFDQGSVYVFTRSNESSDDWTQLKKLTASDGASGDEFGNAICLDNNTLIVGSFQDGVHGTINQGSAYIFMRNHGGIDNWGQVTKLTASDGDVNDRFGISVSLHGNTVGIGAYYDDINGTSDQGSIYTFLKDPENSSDWIEINKIIASDGQENDYFGYSLSVESDTIVVGSYGHNVSGDEDQGAVYLYSNYSFIDPPTNFTATTISTTGINLSWTKGSNADVTRINRKTQGYPESISDGSLIYNGSASTFQDENLTAETIYYYRAWSWNTSVTRWSTSTATVNNSTTSLQPILTFVSPTPSNNTVQEESYVVLNISIEEYTLDSLEYNWNGTTYQIYNDTVLLMMNFDNQSIFGENESCVIDLSLEGHIGTINGSASWSNTGKHHGGFEFDGINDHIHIPDDPTLRLTDNITISVWIYPLNATATQSIINKEGSIDGGSDYTLFLDNHTMTFASDYPILQQIQSNTTINTSNWYHIAVSYGSNRARLYVNGVLDNSTIFTSPFSTSTQPLSLGRFDGTLGQFFQGTMDELRVWNESLSSEEIYQDYTSNLFKHNHTQWYLFINQSHNATAGLSMGEYCYQLNATDSFGNRNHTTARHIIIADLPDPPTNFSATATSTSRISLSWTEAMDADTTYIRYRKGSSAPSTRSDGTLVYNQTGGSTTLNGLDQGTTYRFTAWSYNQTTGYFSGEYQSCSATTDTENTGGGGSGPGSSNHRPQADAGGSYAGVINTHVFFDGSQSSDTETATALLNFTWDFGDETIGYGMQPIHLYTNRGNYTVNLIVSDGSLSDTDTTYATIENSTGTLHPPQAQTSGPYIGVVNITLPFDASSSFDLDGHIVKYTWDFGDTTNSNEMITPHAYENKGTYKVILTVMDNDSLTHSTMTNATIYPSFKDIDDDGFLIDSDTDGLPDVFYNKTSHQHSLLKKQSDQLFLIDRNKDGTWDLIYDHLNDEIRPYPDLKNRVEDDGFPWIIILICLVFILSILFIIVQRKRKSKDEWQWIRKR